MLFWHRTIQFLAALQVLVLSAGSAHPAEWRFAECEAEDVRVLLAGDRSSDWTGAWHGGEGWKVRSSLRLRCERDACIAQTTLTFVLQGESITSSSVRPLLMLPGGRLPRTDAVVIAGPQAAYVRARLGPGTYTTAGKQERVFMDYGSVLGRINVRTRTEAACSTDADHCLITSDLLAFLPYTREFACGSLQGSI